MTSIIILMNFPDIHRIEYLFALGIAAGLLAGGWFILWTALQVGNWQRWLDVYLLTILAGIVGARAGYVILHLGEFQDAPLYVFRLWYGALAWQGAVLGAGAAMPLLCRWRQVSFTAFSDGAALAVPVILMSMGWSCRKVGCLIGTEVSTTKDYPVWLVGYLPDLQGNVLPRYELQMLAIGLFLLILVFMGSVTLQNRFSGKRLWLSLALCGAALLLLFTLQDKNFTLDKISALLLMSIGLFLWRPSASRIAHVAAKSVIMPPHENP